MAHKTCSSLLQKVTMVFLVVTFLILSLSVSIRLIFTSFYFKIFDLNPILLDFFSSRISEAQFKATRIEGFYFLESEIQHFSDVKGLVNTLPTLSTISLFVFLSLLYFSKTKSFKVIKFALHTQFYLYITLSLIYAAGYWKMMTKLFHMLFFPHGNWQFPSSSLIIKTYSKETMQIGLLNVCLLSFICTLLCYVALKKWNGNNKNDHSL